jgi:hypothetical protein
MEKRTFDYQLLENSNEIHKVKLLKDYTNIKLNKKTVIEFECINFDICKNSVSKLFVSFVENAKCANCNKKYSYNSLMSFCKDKNIELLEDYSTKKITQYTTIKGKCINYDTCNGSFNKQYMALLDNQKCSDCANNNKFTYSYLMSFCETNNIILTKDYKHIDLSQYTFIEGKCPNYNICKGIINKRFLTLVKEPSCSDCTKGVKNCYGNLITYCEENNIVLLKDYSKQKLDKLSVIEGQCINYEICGKTFQKTLSRVFENAYCNNCSTLSEYNYYSLKTFCDENNIELLKEYDVDSVKHNTKIEYKCPNYDMCEQEVIKQFMTMKQNIFCHDCTTKHKYNYNTLIKISDEYNFNLLKEYKKVKLNTNTIIKGECVNYEKCNGTFNKAFNILLDYENNCNPYCEECSNDNKINKMIATNMEKYGVEYVFQCQEILDKRNKTNIERYGDKCSLKNEQVREKTKDTNLKKYGCENPMLNEIIIDKMKKTNLITYGNMCPAKNSEINLKTIKTNLEKFGTEHYFSSNDAKEKIKKYNLEHYGKEYFLQTDIKKEKSEKTCIEKYGVRHPMQDPEISEKASRNAYQMKKYTLPSGKIIEYQGYENYALDILIKHEKINENDIITKRKQVPKITYNYQNKEHVHFVDIYIKSVNRCIEVKSTWTFEKNKEEVLEKQKAGKKAGLRYDIWIFDGKGNMVDLYE